MTTLRVKICGITKPDQGIAIAQLGATALGFICVPQSPRYIPPRQIGTVVEALLETEERFSSVDRVGVFVNASLEEIAQVVAIGQLTAVQLHGDESPQFCVALREVLPTVEIIRAFRIRNSESLDQVYAYTSVVDTLLVDAYHPHLMGGTGHTLDWSLLQSFKPNCAWFLAGGITPQNVVQALNQMHPDGIDLSSGVELSPGDKDLAKVKHLFDQLGQRLIGLTVAQTEPSIH